MGYKKAFLFFVGISLLLCQIARADDAPLSVYKTSLWVDGPITTIAAIGAAAPLFFENKLINKSEVLNRADVNRFDRSAAGNNNKTLGLASHFVVATALIVPVVYDYKDVGWNGVYLEDMVVYTQVLAVQSAIANIARFSSQRPRPDAYSQNQPVNQAEEYESFYSGHTASIFAGLTAVSMTYTYRHGPSAWPWAITIVTGLGEGAMRVAAGRHFYTDVLTGAAVGTLFGTTIPMLHHRAQKATWSLLPSVGADDAGLVFQKKF